MIGRFNSRVTGLDHLGRNGRHHGRAGMYNAVQSAFAVPSFNLPLVNMSSGVFSIAPTTALGSSTPTFTRATAATTIDFEGLLKTCLSGEVRCLGGRRVRNLIDKTESISADWSHSGAGSITAGATDPLGGTTAFTFTAGGANEEFYRVVAGAISIGDSVLSTAWVKRRTGSGTISLANASGGSFITIPVTSTWQRLSAGVATAGNTNALSDLKIVTSGDAVDFWHPQTENVTGQSNQNPSEYVSVGVLSSPVYHGVGVDGVKVFTTLNGNTVASNVVTEATGAAITSAQGACAGGVTAGVVDAVGPVGYLAEGARTNLCLQSQVLGTTWSFTDATQSANQAVAPDGTTTMDSLIEGSGVNTYHQTYQTIAASNNTQYTFSVFLKAGTRSFVLVQIGTDTAVNRYGALVNLSDGTVTTRVDGSPTVTSNKVTQLPNGIYRVEVSAFNTSGTINVTIALSNSATPTYTAYGLPHYTGDGASLAYAWGVQHEAATFASSYIPTTTAAVARNADVLTYVAAGNMSGASGGAYAELTLVSASASTNPGAVTCTGGNFIYVQTASAKFGVFDGTTQVVFGNAPSYPITSPIKVASSWGGSSMGGSAAGSSVTSGAFDGSIGGTTVSIGLNNGTNDWYGTFRNVRIYPRALSDAQLQAMTA